MARLYQTCGDKNLPPAGRWRCAVHRIVWSDATVHPIEFCNQECLLKTFTAVFVNRSNQEFEVALSFINAVNVWCHLIRALLFFCLLSTVLVVCATCYWPKPVVFFDRIYGEYTTC